MLLRLCNSIWKRVYSVVSVTFCHNYIIFVLQDWKCIISMLLDETPIAELTDMDGTNLVRMLRASAKKAVGERIVPATDSRKMYYNKSQKVSVSSVVSYSIGAKSH